MNTFTGLNLIGQALSRARTPKPQDNNSEAHRTARQIAISARRTHARELGNR